MAPQPEPANDPQDLIFDASQVRGEFLQASFELSPEAQGLFAFQLEGSEDLLSWRPLGGIEQLARLRNGAASVERLQVDLQGRKARYLRMRWQDPAHAPRVFQLRLDALLSEQTQPTLQWTAGIAPSSCGRQSCDYPMPGPLPLHALRIELQEANVLAPVTLSGLRPSTTVMSTFSGRSRNPLYALRHKEPVTGTVPEQEQGLASSMAYRIQQGEAETTSPDIALDGLAFHTLRLRSSAGPITQLGARPPLLKVASQTRSLLFLAQGTGPYVLSWQRPSEPSSAASVLAGASLALTALVPGNVADVSTALHSAGIAHLDWTQVRIDPPSPVADGAAMSTGHRPSETPHRAWLWMALAVGVAALASMVGALLKSMRERSGADPQ